MPLVVTQVEPKPFVQNSTQLPQQNEVARIPPLVVRDPERELGVQIGFGINVSLVAMSIAESLKDVCRSHRPRLEELNLAHHPLQEPKYQKFRCPRAPTTRPS